MMYLDFKDYVFVALKSLLATMIVVPFLLGIGFLIKTNIDFAYYISDVNGILRDLTLTVMSLGFANNIIVLMSVFEFGVIYYLFNKLKKVYINLWKFIINLWNRLIYVIKLFT